MPVFLVSFNGRRAPLIYWDTTNTPPHHIIHNPIYSHAWDSFLFYPKPHTNVYASAYNTSAKYLYTLSRKSQRLFMPNGKISIYSLTKANAALNQRLFKIIFIIILSLFHLHSLFHSPIIITHQYTNQYSNIYTYSNSHHLFITYTYFLLHLFISTLFL